jgi:hypothetical protein
MRLRRSQQPLFSLFGDMAGMKVSSISAMLPPPRNNKKIIGALDLANALHQKARRLVHDF